MGNAERGQECADDLIIAKENDETSDKLSVKLKTYLEVKDAGQVTYDSGNQMH